MAKSATLATVLSEITTRDFATLKVLARNIREAGLIDTGGRGKGGKEMTANDAACMMLGIGCGASLLTAADAVADYWYRRSSADDIKPALYEELKASPFRLELIDRIGEAKTFGAAVAEIIRCMTDNAAFKNPAVGGKPFIRIEIERPRPFGRILLGHGNKTVYDVGYSVPGLDGQVDPPIPADAYVERSRYGLGAISKIAQVIGPMPRFEEPAPFFAAMEAKLAKRAPESEDQGPSGFKP